jgi:tetratricopeptide (TPR) repeat protein
MRIADMLKITLLAPEADRITHRGSVDPEAYRHYQIARGLYNQRTEESVRGAIGHYDEAVGLEPGFALAHAGLADCYTLVGGAGYLRDLPRDSAIARAIASAERAIALDPTLGEAHATLAYVRFRLEWKFAEAETGFRSAIDLNPGLAKAYEWYGLYLGIMKRFDEAIAMMRRAEELDPLSPSVGTGVGRVLYFAAKDDSARMQLDRVRKKYPNYPEAYFALSGVLIRAGKLDSAIALLNRAVELSGRRGVIVAALGSLYARAGRTAEAEEILGRILAPEDGSRPIPYLAAIILEGLGRREEAYEQLLKAYDERDGLLLYLSVDPSDMFRYSDPRIEALLDRIGLPH